MYQSRPITQVIHENINYILNREKLTKELLYKEVGHQQIVHDSSANISVVKLEQIAKFLGTNIPDLVTDWKKVHIQMNTKNTIMDTKMDIWIV